MYDLKKIQTRAMELYRKKGILPPDHLKKAMQEEGVLEDDMWDVRESIRKLEEPPPTTEPKQNKKKVSPAPVGPPDTDWRGHITIRGHAIDLEELNRRDGKLAAAHDAD